MCSQELWQDLMNERARSELRHDQDIIQPFGPGSRQPYAITSRTMYSNTLSLSRSPSNVTKSIRMKARASDSVPTFHSAKNITFTLAKAMVRKVKHCGENHGGLEVSTPTRPRIKTRYDDGTSFR